MREELCNIFRFCLHLKANKRIPSGKALSLTGRDLCCVLVLLVALCRCHILPFNDSCKGAKIIVLVTVFAFEVFRNTLDFRKKGSTVDGESLELV